MRKHLGFPAGFLLAVTLCILLCVSLCVLPAAALQKNSDTVYDTAGLFTAEEIASISAFAEKNTPDGVDIVIATTESRYWGEDFLRDTAYDLDSNLILLIISKDGGAYYYDLYLYGNAENKIRSAEVDVILDHETVYPNLKGGRLEAGCIGFIEIASRAYSGRVSTSIAAILAVSLLIALVIAGIVVGCVIARYKMKARPTNYPLDQFAKLNLSSEKDVFLGTEVRRRHIDSGSRSGGGGGGSSHGGGAGHAGGR